MGFLLIHMTPSLLPSKPGVPRQHTSSSALQPDNVPKGLSVLNGFQPLLASWTQSSTWHISGPQHGRMGLCMAQCVAAVPRGCSRKNLRRAPKWAPNSLLSVFSAEMDGNP